MKINELRDVIHSNAKEKGFWDKERNFGEILMLVVSELGECIDAHQKGKTANLDAFEMNHDGLSIKDNFEANIKDSYADELADAIIRILDLCGGLGIDIEKHIFYKMEYNKTRERLHGKKY